MSKGTDFEKSLKELEEIVSRLESRDITLDESMALFERGMKLSGDCRKALETAKQKIITLTEAEKEAKPDETV